MKSIKGITDVPVGTDESSDDAFNINKYIEGLSQFIVQCDTPMTVSIQGDWGSGKTSMMNLIKRRIEGQVHPIWFNTWQFSQFNLGDNLAFSMMSTLLNGLAPTGGDSNEKIKKDIFQTCRLTLGALAGVVAGESVSAAFLDATSSEGKEEPFDPARQIVEIKSLFQQAIDETLRIECAKGNKKSRVVVFVDDLDRLQPAKAIELLEVLKLFLDCKNCVFVLAVDYEVVTLGVNQKYGGDVSKEKGRSFFDKIIQLPFKMPVSNYDVSNYIKTNLEALGLVCDSTTVETYVSLLKASIGLNPRGMKRLFNTFQLLSIISSTPNENESDSASNQRILFAIICMQMAYERLYRHLAAKINGDLNELFNELIDIDLNNESSVKESMFLVGDAPNPIAELSRIQDFVNRMRHAIDSDGNGELDDAEIEGFTSLLKCSSVTSVDSQAEWRASEEDWNARRRAQDYARSTVAKLAENAEKNEILTKINQSARPRFPRTQQRFREAQVIVPVSIVDRFNCEIDCCLKYLDAENIKVGVTLNCQVDKKHVDDARAFFGVNPLGEEPDGVTVEIANNGVYKYSDITVRHDEIVEKSYELILDALSALNSLVEGKGTALS